MHIHATKKKNLHTVEFKITLSLEEVKLLTTTEWEDLSDSTQYILRNYGLVNHRNKPTDLSRDIASTASFVTGVDRTFELSKRRSRTIVSKKEEPSTPSEVKENENT